LHLEEHFAQVCHAVTRIRNALTLWLFYASLLNNMLIL
jgi:hypothetical protein